MSLLRKLVWYLFGNQKPKSVTKIRLTIWRLSMKVALVKVEWVKSPSVDVVKQVVKINVAGIESVVVDLEPFIEAFGPFEVPEKAAVHVEVIANDGTYDSEPAVLDFVLGDLVAPEAPSGIKYSVVEIVDKNEPAPEPEPTPPPEPEPVPEPAPEPVVEEPAPAG